MSRSPGPHSPRRAGPPSNAQSRPTENMEAIRNSLPFLPGYQFNFDQKSKFSKSHAFGYSNSVPVFREDRPGIGGVPLLGQAEKVVTTSAHLLRSDVRNDQEEGIPAWIAFDRKVLRLYAYFQEAVTERRDEQYRIRKVHILFYLEDDTIHVIEPRSPDSGMTQGTLIRRHRMPLPNSNPHSQQYYLFVDLSVGKEVTFYSRTFKIVGCDAFTRDFFERLGEHVPPNMDYPSDPYEMSRKELLSRMRPTRPAAPRVGYKKFLENDRKVLRFYCIWDDTTSIYGDTRKLVLLYFLADDTIEIHEHIDANCGFDGNTSFLKRGKLPKHLKAGASSRALGGRTEEHYVDRDLVIGAVLNVYGRPFLLCDCDEFTKTYYRECYGLDDFSPIPYNAIYLDNVSMPEQPVTGGAQPPEPYRAPPPPEYNGWGSEEDSLGSCLALTPKPPRKDMQREQIYGSTILRFAGILNTLRQVDRERRFVISYHLSDDTVHVFEPHQRNSGIIGGKWLERSKVKLESGSEKSKYLSSQDLFVGAQALLGGFPFVIIGADEHTLKFMDDHLQLFPNHTRRGEIAGAKLDVNDKEIGRVRFDDYQGDHNDKRYDSKVQV